MLASCSFSFGSDCRGFLENLFPNTQETPVEPPTGSEQAPTETFTFSIVEKRTFYYPTYGGTIVLDAHPDKITLTVLDKEIELKPYKLELYKGLYVFTIESEVLLFNSIAPGEYEACLNAFNGDNVIYSKTYKFNVSTKLVNVGDRMDKELNWGKPK